MRFESRIQSSKHSCALAITTIQREHYEHSGPRRHARAANPESGISRTVDRPISARFGVGMNQTESAVPGLHDFDFLAGHWKVHHRKLKQRLANNHEWIEFEGTLFSQPLMGSYSNVDDLVLNVPGAPYRGVALRSFDTKTHQWSIWWLDSRTPLGPLDPPMRGSFQNGVGTFYGDDTLDGKPVRARFIWSKITRTTCHWEQAYSPDEGKTWETNWVQDIERAQ
jgi:hypothetical protein